MPTRDEFAVEQRISAALSARRAQLHRTYQQLADQTGIDRNRLQRLLTPGGLRLRIDEVVRLCDALEVSHAEILRTLWPGRPVTASQAEVSRLRRENRALRFELASGDRAATSASSPTGELIRALMCAPGWAFTTLPIFTGPSDEVALHYANRFAVTPTDRRLADAGHTELRARFIADLQTMPAGTTFLVWQSSGFDRQTLPYDAYGRHPLDGDGRHGLYLSAPVYTADRPVSDRPVELGPQMYRGVVVLSLREITDRMRIAATLARALGWALTSTGRAAQGIGAGASPDPGADSHRQNIYANLVLGEYLTSTHPHTVMTHAGAPAVDDDGALIEEHALLGSDLSKAPFVVLLSESDAMLEAALGRPVNATGAMSRFGLDQLRTWRDQLRARVLELSGEGNGLVVDLDAAWVRQPPAGAVAEAQLRWQEVAATSRHVLQQLLHLSGRRSRSGTVLRDDVARTLLNFDSPVTWH